MKKKIAKKEVKKEAPKVEPKKEKTIAYASGVPSGLRVDTPKVDIEVK